MARDRELEYTMSLKDDATAAYKKFVGEFEKGSLSIKNIAKTAGVAMAGMFSVNAAVDFMKKAADADAGIQALEQSMRNAGVTGEFYKQVLLDQAKALSTKTAVDDEEIVNVQKLVLSYTQNLDATQKLVPAILDVARATGMSTDAAARLFGRTQEGAEGLKRLGITVGNFTDDQERLAAILDEVNRKFGGQAEAFRKTDAGEIAAAANAWDDLETSLGRLLNSTLIPLVPVLTNVSNGVADMVEEVNKIAKGESAADFWDVFALSLYQTLGATDAMQEKLVELGEKQFYANKQTEANAKVMPPAAAATKTFKEKLDELEQSLSKLDPTSQKYIELLTQKEKMTNQVALATERAKRAAAGLGDTTMDFIPAGNISGALQAARTESEKFFKDFNEQTKKMFGGTVDPAELKAVEDQAALIQELRVRSYREGKQAELAILNEWEENATAMAHEREDLITQITKTAAAERARIEQEYSMQTYHQIAGFAQQAIGLYQQAVAQSSQSTVNTLEARRAAELKGIEKEKDAIRRKYDELLDNENLTAEQRTALRKKQANEEEAILKKRETLETEYENRIRAEKARAFNANKNAQIIASIINTAVEVTKVLATPWMIPIVAGLGTAQTALIASQPTPSFHTGGSAFFNAPETQETFVKIRGQEKIDVYTPEQRDKMDGGRSIKIINYFNVPIDNAQWVADAIAQRLKQTGLPIEEAFIDQSSNVILE